MLLEPTNSITVHSVLYVHGSTATICGRRSNMWKQDLFTEEGTVLMLYRTQASSDSDVPTLCPNCPKLVWKSVRIGLPPTFYLKLSTSHSCLYRGRYVCSRSTRGNKHLFTEDCTELILYHTPISNHPALTTKIFSVDGIVRNKMLTLSHIISNLMFRDECVVALNPQKTVWVPVNSPTSLSDWILTHSLLPYTLQCCTRFNLRVWLTFYLNEIRIGNRIMYFAWTVFTEEMFCTRK